MRSMPNHQLLGPHLQDDGLAIRGFRPAAEQVDARNGRRRSTARETIDRPCLCQVIVPRIKKIPSSRLILQRRGATTTIHDPYSFPPSIGERDLHFFAEGKHEHIYN